MIMINKRVAIDSKLYSWFYKNRATDTIATWVYIKAQKKHPHFKRNLTKKNKPQSLACVISQNTNLSYNTISKHLPILLEMGLIKYDDKRVWCTGSNALTDLSCKLGHRKTSEQGSPIGDKKVIFNINDTMTYNDVKFLVKNSIVITHKIASINKVLIYKESIATIKRYIDDGNIQMCSDKRYKNRVKKILNNDIKPELIVSDTIKEVIPYCAISNQFFSTVNQTTSKSSGYRTKRKLAKLGVIAERRKQLKVMDNTTYSDFLNLCQYYGGDKPLRFYNGIVYEDLPNEVIAINTKSQVFLNTFFKNASKNIISINDLNKNKDLDIFKEKYVEQTNIVSVVQKRNIEVPNAYCPFFGYALSDTTMDLCPDLLSSETYKKSWYMKYNQDKSSQFYLTRKELKTRFGWTNKMVDLLIKNRDADRVEYNKAKRAYKLYSLQTIYRLEQSEVFKEQLLLNIKCKETAYLKRISKV